MFVILVGWIGWSVLILFVRMYAERKVVSNESVDERRR